MTKHDAELLKEKFDGLMLAVETFGKESAQLSEARKDACKLMSSVQQTTQQLALTASRCQEYLETADKLISDGFTQQINQDIEKASGIILGCQEMCEELTKQYQKVLESFREDAGKPAQRQKEIIRAIQDAASAGAGEVRSQLQAQEKSLAALESGLTQSKEQAKVLAEKLTQMEERQEASSGEFQKMTKEEVRKHAEKGQEALSAEAARLSGKLVAIGGGVEQLDRFVNRAFSEKTEYLAEKQRENTQELLTAVQTLDRRMEQLSGLGAKLESQLAAQSAAIQAKNEQLAAQMSEQMKKQQMLMLAGMGVLAVLAALGLII